jgi:hypothetical protein
MKFNASFIQNILATQNVTIEVTPLGRNSLQQEDHDGLIQAIIADTGQDEYLDPDYGDPQNGTIEYEGRKYSYRLTFDGKEDEYVEDTTFDWCEEVVPTKDEIRKQKRKLAAQKAWLTRKSNALRKLAV